MMHTTLAISVSFVLLSLSYVAHDHSLTLCTTLQFVKKRDLIENPYEPTVLSSLPAKSLVVSGFRKNLVYASKFVFWLGMIKFFLGSMISFMPGAETSWFIITAGLVSGGFFVSSKYYRIAALVIVAICVLWA